MPIEILDEGIAFLLSVQGWGAWLEGIMQFFTFLGSEDFYFLVLPVVIWCIDVPFGLRMAAYLLTTNGLNNLAKIAFHQPRPYWVDARVRLLTSAETGFGLPSGHAQNAVVLWGGMASQIRKAWAWVLAVTIFLLIGLSRIYLGVHFPTDVYIGWIIGLILLVVLAWAEKPFMGWFTKFPLRSQVFILLGISLGLILVTLGVRQVSQATFQIPAAWVAQSLVFAPEDPIAPYSMSGAVTVAATMFGMFAGILLFNRQGWLDAGGPFWQRLIRFVVGLIGILILWRGLGIAFELVVEGESFFSLVLRYFRYVLVGGWITWLGPLTFLRLGIARRVK